MIISVLSTKFVNNIVYFFSKLFLMKILRIFFIHIFCNFALLQAQNCDFIYEKNAQIERYTEGYVSRVKNNHFSLRQVVRIPVVVHVVWKNDEENISEAQIKSQMGVLNKDFRKLNLDFKNVPAGFKDIAADCEIEFFLVQCDTIGNVSTGIMRYKTTVDNIGSTFSNNKRAIYYTSTGGANNWRPSEYLNIWVCKLNNVLGFVTPLAKAQTTPSEDGVVVDYRVFGTIGTAANTPNHRDGRTTTHEVGHYFNLLHIWGSNNSCEDDDLVADTPLQEGPSSGCPSFPASDACAPNIQFSNFMDYTNDECMGLFTQGQKARMLATLNGFRAGILRGSNCGVVSTQEVDFQGFISPNPASDVLKITVSKGLSSPINAVCLMDITGRVIKKMILKGQNKPNGTSEGVIEMTLSNVQTGLYFLVIDMGTHTYSKKVVVLK